MNEEKNSQINRGHRRAHYKNLLDIQKKPKKISKNKKSQANCSDKPGVKGGFKNKMERKYKK